MPLPLPAASRSVPARTSAILLAFGLVLAACGAPPTAVHAEPTAADANVAIPGRIELPAQARENLGITFAQAEYRVVQGVLRLPGRFLPAPGARRTYQAPVDGRIEVLVRPYQQVNRGEVLFRIISPRWHELRLDLAAGDPALAAQRLATGETHAATINRSVAAWQDRLAILERLGHELGGTATDRSEAASRLADLSVQAVEAAEQLVRLRREASGPDGTPATGLAALRFRQLLAEAAAITGLDAAELATLDERRRPRWTTIEAPEVRALAAGIVEGEVAGISAWVTAQAPVLTTTDPTSVRLHAAGLQADLPRLKEGLPARIVAYDPADRTAIPATVVLGPVADAIDRSVEVIALPTAGARLPAWVRPGVTALLEIAVRGSADEELAIPVAATVPDGLVSVFFRRDPHAPDAVQRVEADLGISDGRWVVVNSGLKEGDEVVLAGVHPLTNSLQTPAAGAAKPDPHASCGGH